MDHNKNKTQNNTSRKNHRNIIQITLLKVTGGLAFLSGNCFGWPPTRNNSQGVMLNHLWLLNHRNKNHRNKNHRKQEISSSHPLKIFWMKFQPAQTFQGVIWRNPWLLVTFFTFQNSSLIWLIKCLIPGNGAKNLIDSRKLVRCFKTSLKSCLV